jgi:hypothetical protein
LASDESAASESDDSGSPAGAAGIGAALGAALFGAGWWLLRRYGYIA